MLSDFMLLRCRRAPALYHPVGELAVDPRCLESANLTLTNECSDLDSNQECELSLGLTRTIFALCNGNRNDRCRHKDKQAAFDSSLLMFERCRLPGMITFQP